MNLDLRRLSALAWRAARYVGLRLFTCVLALSMWGCAGPVRTADDGRAPRTNPWGRVAVAVSPPEAPTADPTDRPVLPLAGIEPESRPADLSAPVGPTSSVDAADSASEEPDEPGMDDEGESAPEAPVYSACAAPLDATEPLYVLPYAVGNEYPVRQGTCGAVTHRGAFSYAYDFEMPRGTDVLAARGGIVTSVVENHPENTNRSSHANYVVLTHEDGQHSRYLHLKTDGVVVAVGDTVLAGDLIAYSGNSGRSSRPHLHFDVTMGCGRVSSRCPTLPVTFMNANDKALRGGRSYPALIY